MKKLFPRVEVLGTFNAQDMCKAPVREGKLDGCTVMKAHAIFQVRFAGTSPAVLDVSPGHVEAVDGDGRKILISKRLACPCRVRRPGVCWFHSGREECPSGVPDFLQP